MAQNLLARVRLWTIFIALAVGVGLGFAISSAFGLGVFLTALWAAAGLWLLEKLLRAVVVPPGTPRNGFAVFCWATAKFAVYGVAVWVLFSRPLPTLSHAVGFTIMMVVLAVFGAKMRSTEIRLSPRREDDAPDQS